MDLLSQAAEWRRAADRMKKANLPVTALFFRNLAFRLEQEVKATEEAKKEAA